MNEKDGEAGALRDLKHALPIALLRAREAVMSQFRPMLARHGVTEQQWRVMRALDQHGQQDASELCERAFILAPSMTRILRTLEENDLVTRARDEEDGRRILIELTPRARDLIKEVTPESRAIYRRIEAAYGKERVETLLELLGQLADVDMR